MIYRKRRHRSRPEEAELLARMIKVSTMSVVLADSSKIGRRGFGRICEIQDVDILITDSGIPEDVRRAFEAADVHVIVA